MRNMIQWVVLTVMMVGFQAHAEVDTRRLASVDANATEILIRFGLQENLVAVDVTSQSLLAGQSLPDLGYHRALSAEGILSEEPTLVIGSSHMGPAAVVETLHSTNIPLIQLPAATTVDELTQNVTTLGAQLSRSELAVDIIASIDQQYQEITARASNESPTMIFLLNMSGRGLSKAGQGTTGNALIQILGGQNLGEYSGYQSVSMEALMALNPDVILVGNGEDDSDAVEELLEAHPLLAHVNAAKQGRLLNVDAGKMVAGVSLGVMTEALRLSQLVY